MKTNLGVPERTVLCNNYSVHKSNTNAWKPNTVRPTSHTPLLCGFSAQLVQNNTFFINVQVQAHFSQPYSFKS